MTLGPEVRSAAHEDYAWRFGSRLRPRQKLPSGRHEPCGRWLLDHRRA